MQRTIVYSEPLSRENWGLQRATAGREPDAAASYLEKRTKRVSEPGHQENQIGRRADVVRELSMEASYAGQRTNVSSELICGENH